MTALAELRVPARANWGRWVADCPICPSADLLRPRSPVFSCVECGTRVEVEWPSEEMVHGIERLLMMRPNPANRNWEPGETLNDLMWENGCNGIFSNLPADLGAAPLLVVESDRIRVDSLPALTPGPTPRELVA